MEANETCGIRRGKTMDKYCIECKFCFVLASSQEHCCLRGVKFDLVTKNPDRTTLKTCKHERMDPDGECGPEGKFHTAYGEVVKPKHVQSDRERCSQVAKKMGGIKQMLGDDGEVVHYVDWPTVSE